MSDLTRIKDKLAKLLRLGEDTAASTGEIQNALNAAALLMARHQLTRDDIDLAAADPTARVALGRHFAFCKGANMATWECKLAHFVCDFIGPVKYYATKNQPVRRNGIADLLGDSWEATVRTGTAVAFYGADEDARCAAELFEELRDATATMAIVRWGSWFRGDGANYAYGFALGLEEANRTAKRELMNSDATTSALMIRSEANSLAIVNHATDWLAKEHKVKLSKGSKRSVTIRNFSAMSEGRRDGSNYSLSKPGRTARIA